MAVYASIMNFVESQSLTFIGAKTAAIAAIIQPAVVTLMGVYIILWGLAHIRGMVQEPMMEFVMRIVKMIAIFAIGIGLWGYNEYIVDTFMKSPDGLASALAGNKVDTVNTLDHTLSKGFDIGNMFWKEAGINNIGAYLGAFMVWLAIIAVTAYAAFLIILSKILLSVLIALGPIFIALMLFQTTAKFFESWIAQLANYALVVPLVTACNVFILNMFEQTIAQAAALGGAVQIADTFPLLITGLVSFLVLAQIPSVSSGLAGGISLSSFGLGRKVLGSAVKPTAKYLGKKSLQGGKQAGKYVTRKAVKAFTDRRNKVSSAA